MKIRICLLIILMGLLYPGYISSQESLYVFRQIGVVEGLPDNYVKSVAESIIRSATLSFKPNC